MKRFTRILILLLALLITANAQMQWNYKYKITFAGDDTLWALPYLCAVDENGRLYVASSKIYGLGGHNAIYYADSTDKTFKKLIDFDLNGDSDTLTGNIGFIRGISTIKSDVLISASVPYQRSKPNTVGTHYYYPNGDTVNVEKFGFYLTGSGYGTYLMGSALTTDSFAIAGVYQTTLRFYNFTKSLTSPARGSYIPPAPYLYPEIGGHDPSGISIFRDIATIPGGNYATSTETPFYTVRNGNLPSIPGGIAVWSGATTASPKDYQNQRVQDPFSDLVFDNTFPYGITVDKNKVLWVAGTDTTRRWVKGYMMLGSFATQLYELPAQFSSSNPDPNGAPITKPADVALTEDALTAYVIDVEQKCAFKFQYGLPSSVEKETVKPISFELAQNYPNPFNPATMISYSLPDDMKIKLSVFNTLGQEVAVLKDGFVSKGKHIVQFNAKDFPSGIYYYTLATETQTLTKKMVLAK